VTIRFVLNNCRILDISFNRLKRIEGLQNLTKLKRLFLVNNKIGKIENVGHLRNLELLELGDNKIRVCGHCWKFFDVFLLEIIK
jgi:protein phosphatase 1 regulatory subunit 7